jgi:iron complex outermembrane receptor protein
MTRLPKPLPARRTVLLIGVVLLLPAGRVAAAPAPTPGEQSHAGQIEQVVVTASKRNQAINKVPESISVLSGNMLQQKHILDYADITRELPGISFAAGASVSGGIVGPNTANIVIRGISSTSGSATVALYLDDQSITQSNLYVGAEQPKFLDIARVEVLRGPQGTLFGASSMGGTIRLITNQPQFNVYSGNVSADISGTEHGGVNTRDSAVVNIPLVQDKMALRLAAETGEDSGYIDRYAGDGTTLLKSGVNTEHWYSLRGTLKYKPADDWTITLSVTDQYDHTGDTPVFYPQLGTYKENKAVTEPSADYLFIPSLTVKKDFNDFSVTSVTGYFQRKFSFQSDGTFFNSAVIAGFLLDPQFPDKAAQNDSIIGTLPSQVHRTDRTFQGSEELRATSTDAELFGRPINWIGGVYLEYQRQVRDDFEPAPGIRAAFQKIYGYSIYDSPIGGSQEPGVSYANDLVYSDNQWLDQIQYAVFGQVDYKVLPRLTLTAGLRYEYATQNYYRNSGGVLAYGNVNPFTSQDSTYAATPKASITYDVNTDSIVYATFAKGFRLGGPTGPVAGPTCGGDLKTIGITDPPTKYGPDKLYSYDAGVKELFLDKKVSVNVGVYYIDWENIQQSINLPTCGASITQNLGAAESYGTEIEALANVMDGLTLRTAIGITHSVITSSPNALAAAPGQDVLNTPKWTGSFGFNYTWPITDAMAGFLGSDFDVVGSSHGAFNDTDPAYVQPSYTLLNANVGVTLGPWRAMLYGKNLADDKLIIQRPSINFVEEGYTLRPLTVGFTVSRQF